MYRCSWVRAVDLSDRDLKKLFDHQIKQFLENCSAEMMVVYIGIEEEHLEDLERYLTLFGRPKPLSSIRLSSIMKSEKERD